MAHSNNKYIISSPSGGGKTSLTNMLQSELDFVKISVSHTTRPLRKGETDKVDYHFVSSEKFNIMIQNDDFVEYAKLYDYYYGTSKQELASISASGKEPLLVIDYQGADIVCKKYPNDFITIFLLPPSLSTLFTRLKNRKDTYDIEKRIKQAKLEAINYKKYQFTIINDNFEKTLQQLKTLIRVNRKPNKKNLAQINAFKTENTCKLSFPIFKELL